MSNPIEILCDLLKESGLKMRFPKNADSATIGKAIDLLADRQREQQGALAAKDAEIAALKAKLAAWDKAAIEVGYCHEAEGHNPVAVGPKTMAESVLMERDQKEPLYEEISDLRDKLEEAEAKAGPTREEIRVAVHWAVGHAMGEKSGPTMNNKFRSVHQITKEAMRRLFPTAPVDEENNDDS